MNQLSKFCATDSRCPIRKSAIPCALSVTFEYTPRGYTLHCMTYKRIVLTVPRKVDEFLKRMAEETGIDRSNLIRTRLWEWMTQERDRAIAEKEIAKPGATSRK